MFTPDTYVPGAPVDFSAKCKPGYTLGWEKFQADYEYFNDPAKWVTMTETGDLHFKIGDKAIGNKDNITAHFRATCSKDGETVKSDPVSFWEFGFRAIVMDGQARNLLPAPELNLLSYQEYRVNEENTAREFAASTYFNIVSLKALEDGKVDIHHIGETYVFPDAPKVNIKWVREDNTVIAEGVNLYKISIDGRDPKNVGTKIRPIITLLSTGESITVGDDEWIRLVDQRVNVKGGNFHATSWWPCLLEGMNEVTYHLEFPNDGTSVIGYKINFIMAVWADGQKDWPWETIATGYYEVVRVFFLGVYPVFYCA